MSEMIFDARKTDLCIDDDADLSESNVDDFINHKKATIARVLPLYTSDFHQFCAGVNLHFVLASVLHNEVLKGLENAFPEEPESAMTNMSTLSCNYFDTGPIFDTPTDTHQRQ